jgi:hypothetical protein
VYLQKKKELYMQFIPQEAQAIPYNSQNNDALIKELKFALKSARE